MSKLQLIILLYVVIHCTLAHQNYDVYLAAQLDTYCRMRTAASGDNVESSSGNIPVGRIGKAGPRGPPGNVNYSLIEEMIDIKVAAKTEIAIAVLAKSVEELQKNLTRLEKATNTAVPCEGTLHEGKCYVVIVKKMLISRAKEACRNLGGKMANIYSQRHYENVMAYMPPHMDSSHYEILLGMTYNSSTSEVHLTDGQLAPYVTWLRGWPSTTARYSQISVRVNKDISSSYKGMWNTTPAHTFHGVLCEI